MARFRQVTAAALIVLSMGVGGASTDDEWFVNDVEERLARVNDGHLRFLLRAPAKPAHYHDNTIVIDESSLGHGWVQLFQCHQHLDPVRRAEVVFRKGRIRDLRILSYSGVGRAWVEENSVQLVDIGSDATLCLAGESKVLTVDEEGVYTVRNGPFMRRFLDGYYPMRVKLTLSYPCTQLKFIDINPSPQAGFQVIANGCQVSFDTWFEGRLNTEIRFEGLATPLPKGAD